MELDLGNIRDLVPLGRIANRIAAINDL